MLIIEIRRYRVDAGAVARLLEVRGAAMAEFREHLPHLRQADLVDAGDGVWLDLRTWVKPVDPATVAEAVQRSPAYAEMLALLGSCLGREGGERVHTTGTAWAAGR
jgi:hypothetical protein